MPVLIEGRSAIVVGASSGMGRAVAGALAEAGANVMAAARRESRLSELRENLAGGGHAIEVCPADVTKPRDVEKLIAATRDCFGRIDLLVYATGTNVPDRSLEVLTEETWEMMLSTNLTGAFLCSQAIGSEMARRAGGVILNVASDLAVIAPDQRIYRQPELADEQQPAKPVTYSVVKAGLVGLTRYLATYWPDKNVRVNAISPGGVYNDQPDEFVQKLTNLIPMGRMANIDEYMGAVLFLCSDASSYMTGHNLVIDGGRSSW